MLTLNSFLSIDSNLMPSRMAIILSFQQCIAKERLCNALISTLSRAEGNFSTLGFLSRTMALNAVDQLLAKFDKYEISQFDFIDEVICLLQNESQTKFNINHNTTFITSFINFLEEIFVTNNNLSKFIWFINKILNETQCINTKLELEVHTQIFQFVLSKMSLFQQNPNNQQLLYWSIMNHVINAKNKLTSNSKKNTQFTKQYAFYLFDIVCIHSLTQRPEYNGINGIILNFDSVKQRYHVHFKYDAKPINILLSSSSLTKISATTNNNELLSKLWIPQNIKLFIDFMIKEKTSNLCAFYDSQWKNREILININEYIYKIPFTFNIFGDKDSNNRKLVPSDMLIMCWIRSDLRLT